MFLFTQDVNHNSGIFQIECQVSWMLKIIKKMQQRNAKTFAVKEEAESDYMEEMKRAMKKTIYGNYKCGSWFEDKGTGNITALYPKSSISYWKRTKRVHFSSFDFVQK